jgi:hypothetical protein
MTDLPLTEKSAAIFAKTRRNRSAMIKGKKKGVSPRIPHAEKWKRRITMPPGRIADRIGQNASLVRETGQRVAIVFEGRDAAVERSNAFARNPEPTWRDWWHWQTSTRPKPDNGISNATSNTRPPPERSFFLTARGTIRRR